MEYDWGYGAHGLRLGIYKEKDIGCRISVDGFGVVNELVDFTTHGCGLELKVEGEVDCGEYLFVGVETFGWWDAIELVFDTSFEDLLQELGLQLWGLLEQ